MARGSAGALRIAHFMVRSRAECLKKRAFDTRTGVTDLYQMMTDLRKVRSTCPPEDEPPACAVPDASVASHTAAVAAEIARTFGGEGAALAAELQQRWHDELALFWETEGQALAAEVDHAVLPVGMGTAQMRG